MAQNPDDVNNPGVENVADQAFDGLPREVNMTDVRLPVSISPNNRSGTGGHRPFVIDQEILVDRPASVAVTNLRGDDGEEVRPVVVDQPVTVTSPGPSLRTVQGGNFAPGNGQVVTPQENDTVGQVFGSGLPREVFV